jgi:hypothetical protein
MIREDLSEEERLNVKGARFAHRGSKKTRGGARSRQQQLSGCPI